MRVYLVFFIFVFHCVAHGQQPVKDSDMFAMDLEKNILRVVLTAQISDNEGWPLMLNYEREIKRPFTLVFKGGPEIKCYDTLHFSVNAFGAIEFRFYCNLLDRIKKGKRVYNFSAPYFSIEETFLSDAFLLSGVNREKVPSARGGTFFNFGIQNQFKRGYFNAFFGMSLRRRDTKRPYFEPGQFHVGIALGKVLTDEILK